MATRWVATALAIPAVLRQHDVQVYTAARVAGSGYARIEPASPRAVMIFGRNGEWRCALGGKPASSLSAFACGPTRRPIQVTADSVDACIEVSMPAWIAVRLLPGLRDSCDTPVSVRRGACAEFADRAVQANNMTSVAAAIARWLAQAIADQYDASPCREIDWAWRKIAQHRGALRVAQLAADIGWSERRFHERFRAATGLGPKVAARLHRFQAAYNSINGTTVPLVDIANAHGYADQSHMNREFIELGGIAPGVLRHCCNDEVEFVAASG
jgi:AraC-like DNA-binding protein